MASKLDANRLVLDNFYEPRRNLPNWSFTQVSFMTSLAYLEEYSQKVEAVPLIGDDLLSTWDDKRVLRGLQALAATSSQIQPILFSHHSRVLELAQSALQDSLDVIDLNPQ